MSFYTKDHKFKPQLHFSTGIRRDPNRERYYIEIPRGFVFVGEGAEVEVDIKWCNEEVVSVASYTPDKPDAAGELT